MHEWVGEKVHSDNLIKRKINTKAACKGYKLMKLICSRIYIKISLSFMLSFYIKIWLESLF